MTRPPWHWHPASGAAVLRRVGWYSVRVYRSEALFLYRGKKIASLLASLAGVPANAAEYRGHGRGAHATKEAESSTRMQVGKSLSAAKKYFTSDPQTGPPRNP